MNILIVDDEKRACTNLKSILIEYIDYAVNIVGFAHNSKNAEKLIKHLSPDVIFLDIEMPGENAFSFLERISPFSFEVIFVTAYDEYAIRAFKLNAIDYILKPISIQELRNAMHKLEERLKYKHIIAQNSYKELANNFTTKQSPKKITIKDGSNIEILSFSQIIYIEAMGSYCRIHFNKAGLEKSCITSYPIAVYEDILPTDLFFRIHKSYLVNSNHFEHIHKDDNILFVMKNGTKLPISRRRYSDLKQFLNKK